MIVTNLTFLVNRNISGDFAEFSDNFSDSLPMEPDSDVVSEPVTDNDFDDGSVLSAGSNVTDDGFIQSVRTKMHQVTQYKTA